jgi:anti-sigma factor RsiW
MDLQREPDCTDLLLDLVCYEILSGRLSPEMEDILHHHLNRCPACRRKALSFHQILRGDLTQRNFG